jgi:hypothetical protein
MNNIHGLIKVSVHSMPSSASSVRHRRFDIVVQTQTVHDRLSFVKDLDMTMGIEHRNREIMRMLPDPVTVSATKKASGVRAKRSCEYTRQGSTTHHRNLRSP